MVVAVDLAGRKEVVFVAVSGADVVRVLPV